MTQPDNPENSEQQAEDDETKDEKERTIHEKVREHMRRRKASYEKMGSVDSESQN